MAAFEKAQAGENQAQALVQAFADRLCGTNGVRANPALMQIAQNQAKFAYTTETLGILAYESRFFEFDPNSAHHNVRAVAINFADGPDHLRMILQSMDDGEDPLWVTCVLNSSSINFKTGAAGAPAATRALVHTLVDSAPTLSQSPVLVDVDYRSRRVTSWAAAPDAATQTLLVFVTLGFGNGEEAVVRVCRVRGANLVCGNESCRNFSCAQSMPIAKCRMCTGIYVCNGACLMAASAAGHLDVCNAIRATHRAWVLHRRTPAEPFFIVPEVVESVPDTPAADDGGNNNGGGGGAEGAVAAADARPAAGPGAEDGDNAPITGDDEVVDDAQPLEDEVVFETPPPAAAALRLFEPTVFSVRTSAAAVSASEA